LGGNNNRGTLDLEELGVLSEPPDPAFHDEITFEDLAGDYCGPYVEERTVTPQV